MPSRSRFAAVLLLALASAGASAQQRLEPVREDQPASLVRAVFAQGRAWLLGDDGRLSSVAPADTMLRREALAEPARDLCVRGGAPVIVTGALDKPESLHVRHLGAQGWATDAVVAMPGDEFLALACSDDGLLLLTGKRLIDVRDGQQRVHEMTKPYDPRGPLGGVISAVHATPGFLFIGTNRGEWGGSLIRIDRRADRVTPLQVQAGLPFNAIVDDPWKPGCVVAAQGLIHFESSGQLVEVCGDDVRTLHTAKVHDVEQLANGHVPDVAFFGLAADAHGLLAVETDGLHRIDASHHASVGKLPAFKEIGGVWISFDLPGFVLVRTSVNQRHAISGMTPMLVPR